MEKVILTTSQLNQLAFHHPTLATSFYGTVPCDGLPDEPDVSRPQAYIVNTDPCGTTGSALVGRVDGGNACEVFDSFALDLRRTERRRSLADVVETSFQIRHEERTERAIVAQSELRRTRLDVSGGQIARAESVEFPQRTWSRHDYVANDHRVGQWVKT